MQSPQLQVKEHVAQFCKLTVLAIAILATGCSDDTTEGENGGADCASVCQNAEDQCGQPATNCQATCASLSAAARECIASATSCSAIAMCDTVDPDSGVGGSNKAIVKCLGPSCPQGECDSSNDCSAYANFSLDNSASWCTGAQGSEQFCIAETVDNENGTQSTTHYAIDCSSTTPVQRTCESCGYNYSPDDCVKCDSSNSCLF